MAPDRNGGSRQWSLASIMLSAAAVILMNMHLFWDRDTRSAAAARPAARAASAAAASSAAKQGGAGTVKSDASASGGGVKVGKQASDAKKMTLVDTAGRVVDMDDPDAWKTHAGKVHWFTILNAPRYYWCEMIGSAYHNGITMNIWGWGNEEFNDWLATWMKIPLAVEFSEGLPDDALMGFVDGADSLFQRPTADMLPVYEELVGKQYNFAMSTEINCAVQSLERHGCDNERFPMTPWGRRYLNSGLYMGKVGEIRSFLKFVEKYYLPRYRQGSVQRNDQSVIGKAWHDGWSQNFTLDAETKLFQSVRMAETHYCNPDKEDKKHPVPDPDTKLLKNCLTNNVPGVMHFNGKAKPFLEHWIQKFWWYGQSIDPRAVVFVNKEPKSLKALCPKLTYAS